MWKMWKQSPPPLRPVRSGLFEKAKAGDTEAIRTLADWFYTSTPRDDAHRIAARYGLESADLLNEAVLALVYGSNKAPIQDTQHLVRYVYRLCVNRARRLVRNLRRWCQPADGQLETVVSPGKDPGDDLEGVQVLEEVLSALRELPAEQEQVVRLFCLEGQCQQEIAVALDIPMGTVKTRLFNARKQLVARLEGKL